MFIDIQRYYEIQFSACPGNRNVGRIRRVGEYPNLACAWLPGTLTRRLLAGTCPLEVWSKKLRPTRGLKKINWKPTRTRKLATFTALA